MRLISCPCCQLHCCCCAPCPCCLHRFPQVYVDGEFFGGCDIMIEAYQTGELQETLERVLNE